MNGPYVPETGVVSAASGVSASLGVSDGSVPRGCVMGWKRSNLVPPAYNDELYSREPAEYNTQPNVRNK